MKTKRIIRRVYRRLIYPMAGLVVILATGTVGYRMIGGPQTSIVDALYMTFITVATIGYGEIVFWTGASCANLLQCNAAALQALRPYSTRARRRRHRSRSPQSLYVLVRL